MTTSWQLYREPLHTTLLRTITIALLAGGILAFSSHGRVSWPLATVLLLWFSFGGHWVELWYVNWLRPRLSPARPIQLVARVTTWLLAGTALGGGMILTARAIVGVWPIQSLVWWRAGFVFIGVELVAHLVLQVRGRASFYNGRG